MVSLSILLLIGIQVISNFLFSPPCCHQDPRSGSLCTCGSGFKISQGRVEGERITQFFRQELTSENGPGQVALYGRGVTTRVTSRGAWPAGPAAEASEGGRAQPLAGAWGRGLPGAGTWEGLPASVPSIAGSRHPLRARLSHGGACVGRGPGGLDPHGNLESHPHLGSAPPPPPPAPTLRL